MISFLAIRRLHNTPAKLLIGATAKRHLSTSVKSSLIVGGRLVNKTQLLLSSSFLHHQQKLFDRSFCNYRPFIRPKSLEKIRAKDGMPKSFTLIYRTDFQNYFLCAQVFVMLSIVGVAFLGISRIVLSTMPENEKQERIDAVKARHKNERQKQIDEKNKRLVEVGYSELVTEETAASTPNPGDMADLDWPTYFVLLSSLVILNMSLFMLLRTIPIRIYTGKKNHCVGIFYSSLIPTQVSRRDFIAGTVTKYNTKFFNDSRNKMVYKDGSGYTMLFLEQFFRNPADFDYLLGLGEENEVDPHYNELEALKEISTSKTNNSEANKRNPKS